MYSRNNNKPNWVYDASGSTLVPTPAQVAQFNAAVAASADAPLPPQRIKRPRQRFDPSPESPAKSASGKRSRKKAKAKAVRAQAFPNLADDADGEAFEGSASEISELTEFDSDTEGEDTTSAGPAGKKREVASTQVGRDDEIREAQDEHEDATRTSPQDVRARLEQIAARVRSLPVQTDTGEGGFDMNAPHLELAREILQGHLRRYEVIRTALQRDHSLTYDIDRLVAMKRAMQPRHVYDSDYYKEAVERQYAARGIVPDLVFDVGGRRFVESDTPGGRARTPEGDPRWIALKAKQESARLVAEAKSAQVDGGADGDMAEDTNEPDSSDKEDDENKEAGDSPSLPEQIFGAFLNRPVVQEALSKEPGLATNQLKLMAMKRALGPETARDFSAFKKEVTRLYVSRGLSPDAAFHDV